ncbi:tetratricopeptide repeat protein [Bacillus aquiflavi]|uniref:Tetratricopeptide repeat protein n=1 Tax=Bacillus aquiflavi TaxID=2672567 RepID=A0A6B3W1P1_9BACI|nr:helix-turn-helix domain-containing protein [Bacillus aquiflavi]MBA4537569.1 tetratricopeptide repeat protein [Bacillus aquiflavi]NEY81826.1 tetratricopeptide repeat protein [Bacillus aquiflavi]UAC47815.1 tetratricopeptide repeat protein [Bacillus aquiflavi]
MGKNSQARQQMGKILSFIPTGEYYFTKGVKAYHRRDFHKAIKYLLRATQLEPGEPMILCQLALVYTETAQYRESNELLHEIVEELDEEMVECHYFLANNYAHLGLFREAANHANLYLKYDEDGEFVEDAEDLLELLSLEADEDYFVEDDLIIQQEEAKQLLESGKFAEVVTLLKKMINEYPEFWPAYNNLALAYFYLGEIEKSAMILQEVLERNEGNLHALCNSLVFLHYQNRYDEVNKLADMLEKVKPLLQEHQFKLGATFALIGRYKIAYLWLRRLQKYGFDGNEAFYYWLSYSAYHIGKEERAREAWEKTIKLNPEKIGLEPWNQLHIQAEHLEENFTYISTHLNSQYIEERLFALFLIAISTNKDQMLQIVTFENETASSFEREYMTFIKTGASFSSIKDAHETAKNLYKHYHPVNVLESGLYLMWFSIFVEALQKGMNLKNPKAWAAAVEYVWSKLRDEKIPQSKIAEKYNVSSSTVQKYVKMVNFCLQ